MNVVQTDLPGVLIVEPRVFDDERGYFFESYQAQRYQEAGIRANFVQDNMSRSKKGVLRGLHYQLGHAQAKLVQVLSGEVFDVAVDIRKGSPHFGKWVGVHLSAENKRQLYIPEGFAHGFMALSDQVDFYYKCSDFYSKPDERGIRWDDPDLGIAWPEGAKIVDARDAAFPLLGVADKDFPDFKVTS